MKLSKTQQGTLYAIISGLCYGLVGYFGASVIKENFSIANMLFWRFLLASIFMSSLLLLRLNRINKEHYRGMLKSIFYGTTFYSLASIFYFMASKYLGTGLAMVVCFSFFPTIVIICNRFLHNMVISRFYYISIFMIVSGLTLLVDRTTFRFDILGIALSVLGGGFYAWYVVASKKNILPSLASTPMVLIGCTITCFIFAIIDNSLFIPKTFPLWFNILGISIFCTSLPALCLLKGLKHISTANAAILSVLEPVFAAIFGVLLLKENFTTLQFMGVITVLAGASIVLLSHKMTTGINAVDR